MAARLVAFGVAALVVTGFTVAGLLFWSRPAALPPAQRASSTFARSLEDDARKAGKAPVSAWAVTKATSAHKMLVVEIEAERLEEASDIAVQIVEPVLSKGYEEVLVYVQSVDPSRDATVRRIQWTPQQGFVESAFTSR